MRGSVIFILLLCFFSCKKTDKSASIKEKENTLVGEKISIDPNSLISESFSRKECNSEYKLILHLMVNVHHVLFNFWNL